MKITFNRGPNISISASADDWQLYLADTEEQEQERDFTADQINWEIEEVVVNNTEALKAYHEANEVLYRFKRWGAADTEPRTVLAELIEQVYGEKL